jgi:hypothetical protein
MSVVRTHSRVGPGLAAGVVLVLAAFAPALSPPADERVVVDDVESRAEEVEEQLVEVEQETTEAVDTAERAAAQLAGDE